MTVLAHREWALDVGQPGGLFERYEGMRLRFSVKRGAKAAAASAFLVFWNAPRTLAQRLSETGTICRVLAGYRDGGAVEMFQGRVVDRSLVDRRGSPEPRVEWQIHASSAVLSVTTLCQVIDGPVRSSVVLEAIRTAIGISADVVSLGDDVTFQGGYVLAGPPRRALQDIAETTGSTWSIVDGRLRVRPKGSPVRLTADLWSTNTGLTEISGPADRGRVRATALLRPGLRPGDIVRLVDPTYSGDVVVEECTHDGDSEGNDWTTSILGRPR